MTEEQFLNHLDGQDCPNGSLLVLAPDQVPDLPWAALESLLSALTERLLLYLDECDTFACLERRQYAFYLPGKTLQQAYDVAEAVRVQVESQTFPANAHRPRPCNLTVSIGVAERSDDVSARYLLNLARNAFAEACSNGNSTWSSAD